MVEVVTSAIIAAWSVCPPAVRHAHVGGNDSGHQHAPGLEQHEHADSHSHPHPHSHLEEVPEHESAADSSASIAACTMHLHWGLLGFDVSLPAPANPHDPDRPLDSEPMVVRLVGDGPAADLGIQQFSHATPSANTTGVRFVSARLLIPLRRQNSVAALPLCDTARLERSGVLLS